MEIYNPKTQQNESMDKKEPEKRSFFPRSDLNDWLPTWEKIVFFLVGFLGLQLLGTLFQYVLMATPLFDAEEHVFTDNGYALVEDLTYLFLFLFMLLVILLDKRGTMKRILSSFKDPKVYLYALGALALVFLSSQFLNVLYTRFIPFMQESDNQRGIETIVKAQPVLTFLPIVVFAPFCEEMAYRVGLVDTIGHKKRWLGIIFSAIFFALLHFNFDTLLNVFMVSSDEGSSAESILLARQDFYKELLNLPLYLIPGFLFAFIYAKTGKISSSISAHIANNLISYVLLLVQIFLLPETSTSASQFIFPLW